MSVASVKTYEMILEDGSLSRQAYKALLDLERLPETREAGPTANEVWDHILLSYNFPGSCRHNTNARLCELVDLGIAEVTGSLICPLTGYCASTWHTLDSLSVAIKRAPKANKEHTLIGLLKMLLQFSFHRPGCEHESSEHCTCGYQSLRDEIIIKLTENENDRPHPKH